MFEYLSPQVSLCIPNVCKGVTVTPSPVYVFPGISSILLFKVTRRCITLPTFVSVGCAAQMLWLARQHAWDTVDGLFFKLFLCAMVVSLTGVLVQYGV